MRSLVCAVLAGLAGSAGARPCMPTDYVLSYGPCQGSGANGTRTRTWRKPPGASCSGGDGLEVSSTNCVCTMEELVPRYGRCTRSLAQPRPTPLRPILGYVVKHGSECVVDDAMLRGLCGGRLPSEDGEPCGHGYCSCDEDDIGFAYSECDEKEGGRLLSYFYKDTCTPDNASVRLPPSTWETPCSPSCPEGFFIKPPSSECIKCPPGTFSVRGQEWVRPWTKLPEGFKSMCKSAASDCDGWSTSDGLLHSGDLAHNTVSGLAFDVELVSHPAVLSLTYRMESEPLKDFFVVFLNSRSVLVDSGMVRSFKTATIDLAQDGLGCPWQFVMRGHTFCVFRNHFEPYRTETHLSYEQGTYSGDVILSAPPGSTEDVCDGRGWPEDHDGDWVAFHNHDGCNIRSLALLAQQRGAKVVLFAVGVADRFEWPGADLHGIQSEGINIPVVFVHRVGALNRVSGSITLTNNVRQGGLVSLYLRYQKDWSTSLGVDRVLISEIQVNGSRAAAESCAKCPRGHTSDEGSSSCRPCPIDTHAPDFGSPSCTPCPVHHTAALGQSACEFQPQCTSKDWEPKLGPCEQIDSSLPGQGLYQQLTYEALGCDPSLGGGSTKPTQQQHSCGDCPPGLYREIQHLDVGTGPYVCKACPKGHALVAGRCERCRPGQAAVRKLAYPHGFRVLNEELPSTWSTTCLPTGLRQLCWPLTTSLLNGQNLEMWFSAGRGLFNLTDVSMELSLQVSLPAGGSVTFDYGVDAVHRPSVDKVVVAFTVSSATEVISAREDLIEKAKARADPDTALTAATEITAEPVRLPPGKYTLTWQYTKPTPVIRDVVFHLTGLTVDGEDSGGSESCADCPPGHVCRNGEATACPPGTSTGEGLGVCKACFRSQIAPTYASTHCEVCTSGLEPHNGLSCVPGKGCCIALYRSSKNWSSCDLTADGLPRPDCQLRRHCLGNLRNGGRFADVRRIQGPNDANVSLDARIDVDLCGAVGRERGWQSAATDGFVRQKLDDGRVINVGRSMKATPTQVADRSALVIHITGGDRCPTSPELRYESTVTLLCDPEAHQLSEVMHREHQLESRDCSFQFVLRSSAACPLCLETSYRETFLSEYGQEGSCLANGTMVSQMVAKEPCNADTEVGGVPGGTRILTDCGYTVDSPSGLNLTTVVALLVALTFAGLCVAGCYIHRRHVSLKSNYEQLAHRASGAQREREMTSMHMCAEPTPSPCVASPDGGFRSMSPGAAAAPAATAARVADEAAAETVSEGAD
eukprot:TRINITY_DN6398_c4_g1_i1.p1 TRINITY_DN6398_c4_g1~~TRINITY_DN6398_c4_g1_i1.p1  ORF type:complete len:1257 (+),score=342.12 TRINITY_DN6398_c4_g1_i1:55-3825(+)